MNNLFLKRVGLSVALGMASLHAMAASSDDFVDAATEAGIAEVVTGNLAMQKSQNADIKAFAQQMVTDHTKANQQLGDVARKHDISVPDEAALTDKVKKVILGGVTSRSTSRTSTTRSMPTKKPWSCSRKRPALLTSLT